MDCTKDLNCCKVTLKISSDLTYDKNNSYVSTELIGYINTNGEIINGLLDKTNGNRYYPTRGNEYTIEESIKKQFDELAREIQKRDELVKKTEELMIEELKTLSKKTYVKRK